MVTQVPGHDARNGSTDLLARDTVRRVLEEDQPSWRPRDDGYGAISLLLADDHAAARAGMRRALEHHGFCVLGEAGDAEHAVALAVLLRPQVCLLEVDLPGDGIWAIREIHAELPDTRIAMLTNSRREGDVIRAFRAGADGYLMKTAAPDRLSVALEALARGEVAVPRGLTSMLVAELRRAEASDRQRISRRATALLLYIPRFARHFVHRRESGMPAYDAWMSTRARMRDYS